MAAPGGREGAPRDSRVAPKRPSGAQEAEWRPRESVNHGFAQGTQGTAEARHSAVSWALSRGHGRERAGSAALVPVPDAEVSGLGQLSEAS